MKKNFFDWLKGSVDNEPGGASSKKLSAFWALVVLVGTIEIVWVIWAYKHDNWNLAEYFVTADLAFAVAALGINSNEKIKGKATIEEPKKEDGNV